MKETEEKIIEKIASEQRYSDRKSLEDLLSRYRQALLTRIGEKKQRVKNDSYLNEGDYNLASVLRGKEEVFSDIETLLK